MRAPIITLAGVILALAGLARADVEAQTAGDAPPAVTPFVAVTLGSADEQLTTTLDGVEAVDTRARLNSRLELGLGYELPGGWLPAGALEGRSALGVGLVYGNGHTPLHVRQAAHWRFAPGAGFQLFVGLSTGLSLDPNQLAFSAWDLALPVGVRWGVAELAWRPAFALALTEDERAVFGGSRALSAAGGLEPFALALRFHVPGLGW